MAVQPVTVTSFDGFAVNAATNYKLVLNPAGTSAEWAANASLRARQDQPPLIEGVTYGPRSLPFSIHPLNGIALDTFAANVARHFTPFAGKRTLIATMMDGSTEMAVEALVARLTPVPGSNYFTGEFLLDDPVWRATSATTATTSPIAITGYTAQPTITLTPTTTTLKRRRITFTDTTPGSRGLANDLVRATFDSTGASATTAADYIVFYAGRAVPFYVQTLNNASTLLDVRIDVPPGGSSYVDVFYGSSINNTITANTLNYGGLDLTSGSYDLSTYIWSGWDVTTYPDVAGQWKPATLGLHTSGTSYGITAVGSSGVTISVQQVEGLPNDADAIVLTVGGAAGTTNALDAITATLTVGGGTPQARVIYRRLGEISWTVAQIPSGGNRGTTGNITMPLDIDNAVQVAFVLDALDASANGTLAISGAAGKFIRQTPVSVSVGSAGTARILDGTIENTLTGDTIVLTQVYIDDVAFLIDTLNQRLSVASGPVYSTSTNWFEVSNAAGWFPLVVGSNTWTNSVAATPSFAYAAALVV